MNKFYETLTNLRGDVLFGYRAQVVDASGALVDIYRDRSGTRFTDANGNVVNYAEASTDTGMAEFYWNAETGQILQITDSGGELARPPIVGFGDNYVLSNLSGDLPTTAIDGLDTTLAAKADTTYVDAGLAEKVPTADLASTDTGKGAAMVKRTTGGTVAEALTGVINVAEYGAVGDGVTDDTAALIAAIGALEDGQTLDLGGLHLNIFVGVDGVASGDAIALSGVPRLFGKTDVTIQNGKITADSPGIAGSKLRYPSTLVIDGCENVTLRNLTVHSRGQNYGDTDASQPLSAEDRRAFTAQNGGHAIAVIRSLGTTIDNCRARLCGSVGSLYVMSSHDTKISKTFSNPASLGYASFCFDSWAGDASVSGYPAHASYMHDCSTSKEGYTYGSKGCVISEDGDVTVTVEGGYFADAYPNGASRDVGYAFGASSSQTIVNNAVVHNCACVGYAATTNGTDYTYLKISNVYATGLRKTVHQDKDTSVGRTYANYTNVTAKVVGGGEWPSDGSITREETSYIALPNASNRIAHTFTTCTFTGAANGILTDHPVFGSLVLTGCEIETNGHLWNVRGIGGGAAGAGITRGLVFDRCGIEDISSETDAYCQWVSSTVYVYADLSTSTITLNSTRDIESRTIASPGTFIQRYEFPRPEFGALDIPGASVALQANVAKHLRVTLSVGASRAVGILRPDIYRGQGGIITNADATNNLDIRDYTLTNPLLTLTPGQSARWYNDGTDSYVVAL